MVLVAGRPGGDGPPYSPRSFGPDGTRGLVETLDALGATVRINEAVPSVDDTAALILDERLSPFDEARIRAWVNSGGLLVVADPFSRFGPTRATTGSGPGDQGLCTIDALRDVEALPYDRTSLFRPDEGQNSCFGDGSLAAIVEEPTGDGSIVRLGDREMFTNVKLDELDAAVLATALLIGDDSDASITIVGPSITASAVDTADGPQVATRVANGIAMLVVAFVLYAIHRGRRLGRVVREPLPVTLRGSDLVIQTGVLSQRAADPASAAAVLRSDLTRRLRQVGHRHDLVASGTPTIGRAEPADRDMPTSGDATADWLTDYIQRVPAARDLTSAIIDRALRDTVATDNDLVTVAAAIAEIDQALFGERFRQPSQSTKPAMRS